MPYHTVEQGECLASIAKQHGCADYHAIWDDPENEALRQQRGNPNILYPGDRVFIPDKGGKEESGSTEQRHRFKRKSSSTKLRVVVKDDQGRAQAGKRYRLTIDGEERRARTDGQGLVEQPIPPDAREAVLVVWLDDADSSQVCAWTLALGHLDPVDENEGVQARLNNLGFYCGKVDGIIGPHTAAALKSFQRKMGLPDTGRADQTTRARLRDAHDQL